MSEAEEEVTRIIQTPRKTSTLLEQLRSRRDDIASEHTIDITVPGYRGQLALRCAPVEPRQLAAIARRVTTSRSPDRELMSNMDTLILACREIVVRESDGEEWRSMAELDGGEPVGIEERLVGLLKLQPESLTSRELLRSLFALAPSPELAINVAAGEYVDWARAADEDVDAEFVGESPSAPKSG
jgi:hypothetical protein